VDAPAPDALVRAELLQLCLQLLVLEGRPVPEGECDADRLAAAVASGRR
jgi:hypothetical protein